MPVPAVLESLFLSGFLCQNSSHPYPYSIIGLTHSIDRQNNAAFNNLLPDAASKTRPSILPQINRSVRPRDKYRTQPLPPRFESGVGRPSTKSICRGYRPVHKPPNCIEVASPSRVNTIVCFIRRF